jgi:hypothetical protein
VGLSGITLILRCQLQYEGRLEWDEEMPKRIKTSDVNGLSANS